MKEKPWPTSVFVLDIRIKNDWKYTPELLNGVGYLTAVALHVQWKQSPDTDRSLDHWDNTRMRAEDKLVFEQETF